MKISSLLLSLILIVTSFSACKSAESDEQFNPSEYIEAYLNSSLKAKSDVYMQMVGVDEETANKEHLTTLNNIAVNFFVYYEINPSDEQKEALEEVIKTLLLQSNYSVGEHTETQSGYAVEVSFSPILNLFNLQAEITAISACIYTDGADEIDDIINLCQQNTELVSLGESMTVTFDIIVDDSGYIKLNTSLFGEIDNLILPI